MTGGQPGDRLWHGIGCGIGLDQNVSGDSQFDGEAAVHAQDQRAAHHLGDARPAATPPVKPCLGVESKNATCSGNTC